MGGALTLPPLPPLAAGARVWVGYSGGSDSTALLDLLRRAAIPGLRAVHVNHGLQPAAEAWVRHCRRVCRQWGVPLRVLRVQVTADGHGPEAAARVARHAAIATLLRPQDLLVTAHHRDDQAETVLQRALRGTGIAGLGAMRVLEPYAGARLWRPLLQQSRSRLLAHARAAGLAWVDDPHNQQERYTRVFLRQRVLPLLQTHFPDAPARLAQLALHAQATEPLLAALAEADMASLRRGDGYAISGLLALEPERRRNLVYYAWRALGLQPADAGWHQRLEREVLRARVDAEPRLVHGDGEARRYRDSLYLMRRLPREPTEVLHWGRRRCLQLPAGCGALHASRVPPAGTQVRFGVPGARLRPAGSVRNRTLRQLWQAAGVPVWLRLRMPLVYLEDELMAAGGSWRSQRCEDLGLRFTWVHDLVGGALSGAGPDPVVSAD